MLFYIVFLILRQNSSGMGQDGSRQLTANTAAHQAERAKMIHVTTSETVSPKASIPLYESEADRLLNMVQCLRTAPPLLQTTMSSHFLQKKEKITDEVVHHSPGLFSTHLLPHHELTKTLATYQTVCMREGVTAARKQEELARAQHHLTFLVNTLKTTAWQATHNAANLNLALSETDKLEQDINALAEHAEDITAVCEGIDRCLSSDDRSWVATEMQRALSQSASPTPMEDSVSMDDG